MGTVLALIGLSYRQAPVDLVARLTDSNAVASALHALTDGSERAANGAVVVATCNRFEVYLDTARFHDAADAMVTALAGGMGIDRDAASDLAEVTTGPAAARHLFRVASGLDSMVVGEAEISGQVAAALRTAQRSRQVSPALNLLFQSAAHVAKQVASDTELGAAGRSLASVALDAAHREMGPWETASVLIVGTGSYARVVTAALKSRACRAISSFSASGRQAAFAAGHGIDAVADDALVDALSRTDLVVTCSGSGEPTLTRSVTAAALAGREKPLTVIDLAARGDVPSETRTLPGVHVITLAGLQAPPGGQADSARTSSASIAAAESIVDDAVDDFVGEIASRALDPAIVALRTHITEMIEDELTDLRERLPRSATPAVERSLHRIARSLLHTPTVRARALARDGHGAQYVDALHTLFGIEAPAPGTCTAQP